jgi:outer membrane biosynthesis protein TonB
MSNGYVLAANADRAVAAEVAQGFGLELIEPAQVGDREAALSALAGAANLGLIISHASGADPTFAALLQTLAARAPRAQLIAVEPDARARYPFIPPGWAHMTLQEARTRLAEMARRQQAEQPAAAAPPPEPPPPPPPEPIPEPPPAPEPIREPEPEPIPEPVPVEEPAEPVQAEAAHEGPSDDEGEAPTPEQVREYVRGEMRAYYDDQQQIGPILEAVDTHGLPAFVTDTLAAPEDEEVSPAANVLRKLMQLALAALHARGVNVLTSGFGAVADEAARLVGAADLDALADAMRTASERDEDPMLLVSDAAARLADEGAALGAPAPLDEPEEEESFGGEAPAEQAPTGDEPEYARRITLPEDTDAWSEDHESPPLARPAPAPASAPEPQAPPQQSDDAPVAMGRARRDEEAEAAPPPAAASPPPSRMDDPMRETPEPPPPAKKEAGGLRGSESSYNTTRQMDQNAYRGGVGSISSSGSAPADASAFAPKKLRRATPELVQIAIHQPKDLRAVIKAARKADERTDPAPTGMRIGDIALGETVGVSLESRGASCDGEVQRRTWTGAPIHFAFTVEAEEDVKQAVFIARVFVGDAQIGMIAFTRGITGPKKKPVGVGDALRLKRHKRVFLSYSSKDRGIVSAIATAYEAAGIEHFFDRTSLKSGEEWSPRLGKEIDRADLFHLCWSKAAAKSEWVEKEATHALIRRNRTKGKAPNITVQMLDGPPWAPHPAALDSINFDDFVRAAIVGYARGDGSE